MLHPFGALTRNFRLIRLRKFRGQQPSGPAGDGETRVVSAKCLMSLNDHPLRPGGTSPPCFSFTRFIVEQCLLKKTSIWPLLTVWKLPGHHIVLNTADTRNTVMPWRIKVGRSKPPLVLTGGFNPLKPPWSIFQKVVNTGQYESEWSIENFKWRF